jgi:predicted RNA binding protein YcfA (HicA-like mRNA interferase family)
LPPESAGRWPSVKASKALAALLRIGWRIKQQRGSHRILERPGWPDVLFAYHDRVTLGPVALKLLAEKTGLKPDDL